MCLRYGDVLQLLQQLHTRLFNPVVRTTEGGFEKVHVDVGDAAKLKMELQHLQ